MYLKIKFIFYLIGGAIIEEEIYYKKKSEEVTEEQFREDISRIENEFRQDLGIAMREKTNKLLVFGDTILVDKSLLAFKTSIEEVELNPASSEEPEEENNFIQPIEFTVEEIQPELNEGVE